MEETFKTLMMKVTKKDHSSSVPEAKLRQIVLSLFGVDWVDCNFIWMELLQKSNSPPEKVLIQPKYLLWCMFFWKPYNSEDVCAMLFGVRRKTFQKWTWHMVGRLANIQTVRKENRTKFDLPL